MTFPIGSPAYVRQVEEGTIFVHGLKVRGFPNRNRSSTRSNPARPPNSRGSALGRPSGRSTASPVSTIEAAQKLLVEAHEPGSELEVLTTDGPHPARWTITPPLDRSLPVHPTQLYEAVSALLLCLLLLAYDPLARRDGQVFALLLTLYPVSRFLLECIRTDEPNVLGLPLHTGQVVSLLALAAAAGLWFHVLRRPAGRAFLAPAAPAV